MIFIVGVGRSGTSLLQSMLNANSSICFIPEIAFIRRFFDNQILEDIYGKQGLNGLIDILENDDHINRLNVDIPSVLKNQSFADKKTIYKDIYKSLLTAYKDKEKKELLGDKDPRLIENIPLLQREFPDSYVIHIVRDPRDVLLSKMKADWSKNRPWWLHILINKIQLKYAEQGKKYFGDKFIEIKYEELLQNPEKELESLTLKLGIGYEDEMLMFGKSSKKLVSEDEMQWKKETLGPLLTNNKNKWKSGLSKIQIVMTEKCIDLAFSQYKYLKSSIKLNLIQRVYVNLGALVLNLISTFYLKIK